ncbi:MAG: penicillin acylase family protein [Myxococcota bacterium]
MYRETISSRGLAWWATVAVWCLTSACSGSGSDSVQVRYTELGIPHVLADSYYGAGLGWGYAVAQDQLCELADAYVSFRGERSRYFGPDATPEFESTFGRPRNLDSDFFWKFTANDEVLAQYEAAVSEDLHEMNRGYADGFSRYVEEIRSGDHEGRHEKCRDAEWLAPITTADMYRRLFAVTLAASQATLVEEIATAAPPMGDAAASARLETKQTYADLRADLERVGPARFRLGRRRGVGSNLFAFGADATGTNHGLSFANPHWWWTGQDGFHLIHVTIPGEMNVAGISILGSAPIVMGFTENFAWSHTTSAAFRFAFYQLELDPATPTRYVVDGEARDMESIEVEIQVLQADGSLATQTRTLYRTEYGPVADLSSINPLLTWGTQNAFAVRDVSAENSRVGEHYLRLNRADSLQEFVDIQERDLAGPWVTTGAVGRDDPRAVYTEFGSVPNVTDAFSDECTAQPLGGIFASAVPGLPLLDGSRSECELPDDPDSPQPGTLGPSQFPILESRTYVANMNDSYWLANANEPLTGYARVLGCEGQGCEQSWRTRMGHILARDRLSGQDAHEGRLATPEAVRAMVLDSRNSTAYTMLDDLLASFCDGSTIMVSRDTETGGTFDPPIEVDVGEACSVLAAWDRTGGPQSRGAHVWDQFWFRANDVAPAALYLEAFDPARPIDTPAGLNVGNPAVREAFGAAVAQILRSPFDLDARLDEVLYAERPQRIGLFGGCDSPGYFTVHCPSADISEPDSVDQSNLTDNTYLHVVTWDEEGNILPDVMLTHSQSNDPASPHYGDFTQEYAAKRWHRFAFTEDEIAERLVETVELSY